MPSRGTLVATAARGGIVLGILGRAVAVSMTAATAATLLGCTRHLPGRTAPPREIPRAIAPPSRAPAAGSGRVLLDVTDGPAQVSVVVGTALVPVWQQTRTVERPIELARPLCVTPCFADLPYGTHQLRFSPLDPDAASRSEVDSIQFGTSPTAYRRSLGLHEKNWVPRIVGYALLVGGAGSLAIAALTYGSQPGSRSLGRRESHAMPIAFGIAGGVSLATGAILLGVSRPTEQRGAAAQWSLGSSVPRDAVERAGDSVAYESNPAWPTP